MFARARPLFRRALRGLYAVLLAGGMGAVMAQGQVLSFADLEGWSDDDHLAALTVFLETCDKPAEPEWGPICGLARDAAASPAAARAFFELFFRPVVIGSPPALFTGYYEPELEGSRQRTPRFAWPIYARPPELKDGQVYLDRASIERGALRGRGLEIAWLSDPVEVYFLQVQGSGRIKLTDGSVLRVGYAGRNGHAYRSAGKALIDEGHMPESEVSAQGIKDWVRARGRAGSDFLNRNPSYVFFRPLRDLPADKGPLGALGRSITAMRSLAVDPDLTPMGAPIWVEKDGQDPIRSLMVAQDTGGAIKGAQRADIFYGTGDLAGDRAGRIKDPGRMVVLLPIDLAFALYPEG